MIVQGRYVLRSCLGPSTPFVELISSQVEQDEKVKIIKIIEGILFVQLPNINVLLSESEFMSHKYSRFFLISL